MDGFKKGRGCASLVRERCTLGRLVSALSKGEGLMGGVGFV